MDEKEEQLSQLLADHRFIDWVVNPDSIYSSYWLPWIAERDIHAALATEARNFIILLGGAGVRNDHPLPQQGVHNLWQQIADSVQREAATDTATPLVLMNTQGVDKRTKRRTLYWLAAAVVIGLVTTITLFYPRNNDIRSAIDTNNTTLSSQLVRYNGTDKNQLIFLPDGSKITLAKGAQVTYHRLMNGDTRNVELTGEAFLMWRGTRQNPSLSIRLKWW
ncbi:hypothetical protein [Paraflavitalea speifideaquila]|uniref:hypothetical protein n=1 Tax=Paraflavitalea speifideaquila TaxID=3076558 RepID=UPI0028E9FFD4|nr:hypothetical protein [Paraflavitalea speifideiaquila]